MDAQAETLPRFREHRRNSKEGPVSYFYWDGRGRGHPDVPLGTDREIAIKLWQQCEAGNFPRRRASGNTVVRRRGKRRNLGPQWRVAEQWQRSMYFNAERRASELGRSFTLSRDQFFEVVTRANGRCEVSGVPFELGSKGPFAPSLDRIDCAKGYEAGNVRLVCHIANVAMNTWGVEPLQVLARALCENLSARDA